MHDGGTPHHDNGLLGEISHELRHHAPFTFLGALTGIVIALTFVYLPLPKGASRVLFSIFHPTHVFFSALATTAMLRLRGNRNLLATVAIGYVGSVGLAALSDSIIPYLSELFLARYDAHVEAHIHLGFIEEWYLVHPLALAGIAVACWRPHTKSPHTAHVLLSTWASLSHILMSLNQGADPMTFALIPVILFLAVWAPCCTSDIIFPLLFAGRHKSPPHPDQEDQGAADD